MASANCWRCVARPSQGLLSAIPVATKPPTSIAAAAAFTTSAAQLRGEDGVHSFRARRAGKRLVLGKKKRTVDHGKPILPGERKAWRKRIVLSNNSALEVPGLPQLDADFMTNPENVGKMVSIPGELVDQLRAVEAFKPKQNWGLFRSPHMLVRNETVEFTKKLTEGVRNKKTVRMVVTGERSTGKSMLGLQGLATGFMNKWVVINVPEANDLVEARTDYSTIPNSEQFSHPTYILKLMQSIANTNHEVLSQHKIELEHMHLPVSVSFGMSLASLANITKEPDFAWPVFQALWQELIRPGRPPILFSLDGLSHIMRVSDYRSPSFQLIHSHDFSLVRIFVEALGGKTKFPNGAAIIGVNTKGNSLKIASMDLAIEQAAAIQKGEEPLPRDPLYRKYDERVFEALKGVNVLEVQAVSKVEARALMEYWAASGILRMRIDERNVTERWTLGGNGVLGEIERASLFAIRL